MSLKAAGGRRIPRGKCLQQGLVEAFFRSRLGRDRKLEAEVFHFRQALFAVANIGIDSVWLDHVIHP
ncbi:hypothetical protein CCGE531_00435 [Rhizobium sp. CCGE531]|nr:hypothetical protein CCGE531_00435 [Rhizobium sp. CCGE531]AYG71114.1 hypothetical protein CCGE532_00435 [Rhizobium sp. CCGE532]